MKYAVEIGSSAMTYVTKLHKDSIVHSKVDRGEPQTHRDQGDLLYLFLFFKIGEVGSIYINRITNVRSHSCFSVSLSSQL
jgi:hypothetical protein